jgi:hypothetical protein
MGIGEILKDIIKPNQEAARRGVHVCDRPAIDPSWGEGTTYTCDRCQRRMQVVNLNNDVENKPQKAWRNL